MTWRTLLRRWLKRWMVAVVPLLACGGCGASMHTHAEFHGADRDIVYDHSNSNSDDKRTFNYEEVKTLKDGTVVSIKASAGAEVNANVAAITAQNAGISNALDKLTQLVGKLTSALPLLGGLGGLGGGEGGGLDAATLAALLDALKEAGKPVDGEVIRRALDKVRSAPRPRRE